MARHDLIIPPGDAALQTRVCKVVAACKQNGEAWAIDQTIMNELEALFLDFKRKLEICTNPATRTPLAVISKNDVKKSLIARFRDFYHLHLKPKYKEIGDTGWLGEMGLPPLDGRPRQKAPVPTGITDLSLTPCGRHSLEITYRDRLTGKRKPHTGIKFIMLRHAVLDQAPASELDLAHVRLESGKSFRREFDNAHKGKMAYFSACYVNNRGEMGPWSAPVGSLIP
jgi:hypothetical protein